MTAAQRGCSLAVLTAAGLLAVFGGLWIAQANRPLPPLAELPPEPPADQNAWPLLLQAAEALGGTEAPSRSGGREGYLGWKELLHQNRPAMELWDQAASRLVVRVVTPDPDELQAWRDTCYRLPLLVDLAICRADEQIIGKKVDQGLREWLEAVRLSKGIYQGGGPADCFQMGLAGQLLVADDAPMLYAWAARGSNTAKLRAWLPRFEAAMAPEPGMFGTFRQALAAEEKLFEARLAAWPQPTGLMAWLTPSGPGERREAKRHLRRALERLLEEAGKPCWERDLAVLDRLAGLPVSPLADQVAAHVKAAVDALSGLDHLAAKQALLQANAACFEHWCAVGHLPPTLDELVRTGKLMPEPLDPFTGQTLHYDPARGRIWSVGRDRRDDGGQEPTDLVARLAFAEPRRAESTP